MTTPFNVETVSGSNNTDRAQAPAWMNIDVPVGTDENGEVVYVRLPVGIPLDDTGSSYGAKVRMNADQAEAMKRLIARARDNDGVHTYESLPCKVEVRMSDAAKAPGKVKNWDML